MAENHESVPIHLNIIKKNRNTLEDPLCRCRLWLVAMTGHSVKREFSFSADVSYFPSVFDRLYYFSKKRRIFSRIFIVMYRAQMLINKCAGAY